MRHKRATKRPRRWGLIGGIAGVVIVVVGLVALLVNSWLGTYRTAQQASRELTSMRSAVAAKDWNAAEAKLPSAVDVTARLTEQTGATPWRLLAALPFIGPTATAVADLGEVASNVLTAAQPLAPLAGQITSGNIRSADGPLMWLP